MCSVYRQQNGVSGSFISWITSIYHVEPNYLVQIHLSLSIIASYKAQFGLAIKICSIYSMDMWQMVHNYKRVVKGFRVNDNKGLGQEVSLGH